jgi:hypothetical protein
VVVKKAPAWAKWFVLCDCGAEKIVHSGHLFSGQSKSCGCLRDELSSKKHRKHGAWKNLEYRTWQGMKSRCRDTGNKDYPNYGGVGITVCNKWINSFENFIADMGPRPPGKHSIERINNSAGYSPENCRWATRKEQAENRKSNQYVVLEGKTLTVAEAARCLGLHRSTIRDRALAKGETRQEATDHYARQKGVSL